MSDQFKQSEIAAPSWRQRGQLRFRTSEPPEMNAMTGEPAAEITSILTGPEARLGSGS